MMSNCKLSSLVNFPLYIYPKPPVLNVPVQYSRIPKMTSYLNIVFVENSNKIFKSFVFQ